jgi:hypothetical protein
MNMYTYIYIPEDGIETSTVGFRGEFLIFYIHINIYTYLKIFIYTYIHMCKHIRI